MQEGAHWEFEAIFGLGFFSWQKCDLYLTADDGMM